MKKLTAIMAAIITALCFASNVSAATTTIDLDMSNTKWEILQNLDDTVSIKNGTMVMKKNIDYDLVCYKNKYENVITKFKIKIDDVTADNNESVFTISLRDTVPDKPSSKMDDNSYELAIVRRIEEESSGTKIYFSRSPEGKPNAFVKNTIGPEIKNLEANEFPFGQWVTMEVGAVNVDTGVQLTVSINGKKVYDFVDTHQDKITGEGFITMMSGKFSSVSVMSVDTKSTTADASSNVVVQSSAPVSSQAASQEVSSSAPESSEETVSSESSVESSEVSSTESISSDVSSKATSKEGSMMTGLIIGIAATVILLGGAGTVLYFTVIKKKITPDKESEK